MHWSPQYGQSCGPALLTFHESDARRIPARWRPVHIAWWCTRALAVISAHRYLRIMLHRTEPRAVCTSCFTAGWPYSQDGARADSATQYTLPVLVQRSDARWRPIRSHHDAASLDLRYSFSYLARSRRTHARPRGRGERGRRARRQTHPGRGAMQIHDTVSPWTKPQTGKVQIFGRRSISRTSTRPPRRADD